MFCSIILLLWNYWWSQVRISDSWWMFSGNQQCFLNSLFLCENVSKMKLPSDLLNDFFQYCSFQRTMFSAKYCTNSWSLSVDTAGGRLLVVQPIFGIPWLILLFICLRNLFFYSEKPGQTQHRHKETLQFEGQIS